MESFFGTPWEDLDLGAVERFLAEDAEAEGITWEAKGGGPRGGGARPHRDAVRKHVSAFANSEQGGFYILGATRPGGNSGPWELDPLDFGTDEPTTWLSRVIRTGVNPVPPYDVREWAVASGHVAVLRVDPVAEPPCLTMSGEVFTRVSGESVPVTDAETLRRLYSRGEARVDRAVRNARFAAEPESSFRGLRWSPYAAAGPAELRLRVAFAPVGVDLMEEARVLTQSFAERAAHIARALPTAPLFPGRGYADFSVEMTRDSIVVAESSDENNQRWRIEVETDATATVSHAVTVGPTEGRLLARALLDDALRPAIRAATTLAAEAGASGRGFLVLSVVGEGFELIDARGHSGDVPGIPDLSLLPPSGPREYLQGIEAWVEVGGEPSEEALAAMERELLRDCGITVWEPELREADATQSSEGS